MAGDLHTHTTASDGTVTPQDLIKLAADIGLTAVGITDHDTVSGLPDALKASSGTGIEVVPGVELSTVWNDKEIHILGYYIDWHNDQLVSFLENMRQERRRRNYQMIGRLQELGYDLSVAEVEERVAGESMGRPHIAAALAQKGLVPSAEEAFNKLLSRGRAAYIPRAKVPPARAIKIILAAGGVPVLAHPGLSGADSIIRELIDEGLQGIEAYYPWHDPISTNYYLELAARHNLVVTGGSDFHGPQGGSHAELGACQVSEAELNMLLRRAKSLGKNK